MSKTFCLVAFLRSLPSVESTALLWLTLDYDAELRSNVGQLKSILNINR